MTKPVKKRRAYRSVRRAEQADETRRRILEAARKVFVARGFSRTTIAQIADEAGTAVETIYAVFGTKTELLAQTVRASLLREGKEPLQSAAAQVVQSEPDPRELLRLFAHDIAGLLSKVSPIFDVLAAARSEPAIGALYRRMQSARKENLRVVVVLVRDRGGLRPGLDVDSATQTVWALASPELFQLMIEGGWSRERYATWLAETLIATLVAPRVTTRKKTV